MTNGNSKDTAAWMFQVWASFAIAATVTSVGIVWLPLSGWIRAFLGMGLLFTIGSAFSLAKTLRDSHEATRLINRISEAKAENIIRQYELDRKGE